MMQPPPLGIGLMQKRVRLQDADALQETQDVVEDRTDVNNPLRIQREDGRQWREEDLEQRRDQLDYGVAWREAQNRREAILNNDPNYKFLRAFAGSAGEPVLKLYSKSTNEMLRRQLNEIELRRSAQRRPQQQQQRVDALRKQRESLLKQLENVTKGKSLDQRAVFGTFNQLLERARTWSQVDANGEVVIFLTASETNELAIALMNPRTTFSPYITELADNYVNSLFWMSEFFGVDPYDINTASALSDRELRLSTLLSRATFEPQQQRIMAGDFVLFTWSMLFNPRSLASLLSPRFTSSVDTDLLRFERVMRQLNGQSGNDANQRFAALRQGAKDQVGIIFSTDKVYWPIALFRYRIARFLVDRIIEQLPPSIAAQQRWSVVVDYLRRDNRTMKEYLGSNVGATHLPPIASMVHEATNQRGTHPIVHSFTRQVLSSWISNGNLPGTSESLSTLFRTAAEVEDELLLNGLLASVVSVSENQRNEFKWNFNEEMHPRVRWLREATRYFVQRLAPIVMVVSDDRSKAYKSRWEDVLKDDNDAPKKAKEARQKELLDNVGEGLLMDPDTERELVLGNTTLEGIYVTRDWLSRATPQPNIIAETRFMSQFLLYFNYANVDASEDMTRLRDLLQDTERAIKEQEELLDRQLSGQVGAVDLDLVPYSHTQQWVNSPENSGVLEIAAEAEAAILESYEEFESYLPQLWQLAGPYDASKITVETFQFSAATLQPFAKLCALNYSGQNYLAQKKYYLDQSNNRKINAKKNLFEKVRHDCRRGLIHWNTLSQRFERGTPGYNDRNWFFG